MKLSRYRICSPQEVANAINKKMELTASQNSRLSTVIEDIPFSFIQHKKKPTSSFWMRLTVPFYFISYLFLLVGILPKWLITGKAGYEYDSKVAVFIRGWADKVGL